MTTEHMPPQEVESSSHNFQPLDSGLDALSAAFKPMGASDILFVLFSQVRVPQGKFGLSRLIGGTQHAGLFLNDHRGRWYLEQDKAIDDLIEEAKIRSGAKRLVYYGTSMGGYGALATGLRRQDGAIIAYGTDIPLGLPLSQSADAKLQDPRDLIGELKSESRHPVTLCWGLFDPSDAASWALCAQNISNPQVSLVPVGSGHAVHDHLHTVNIIRRMVKNPDNGLADWCAKRGVLAHSPDPTAHMRFFELAAAFDRGEAIKPEEAQALGLDTNPGLQRLAAEIEVRGGNLQAAADRLGRLFFHIQDDPALYDLPHRWVKPICRRRLVLLQAAGFSVEAEIFRQQCAAIYPREPDFMEKAAGGNDGHP